MHLINRQTRNPQNALTTSLLALLILFCSPLIASAESCAGVLLQTIATRWDSLGSAYQREICDRGCQPVMSTWDEWTYSNAFLPLIDTMAKEMSLSDKFKSTFTRIGQDIAASTKKECSALLAPGQHFCTTRNSNNNNNNNSEDKLAQWNRCFKKQAAREASRNAFTMLKLVSGEICKGSAYKFLSDDELWTQILPKYMRKYSDTCQDQAREITPDVAPNAENQENVPKEKIKDEL